MIRLPPCDCLNNCGDDPWLKDGRSEPCENYLAQQQRDQQAQALAQLVATICKLYGSNNILATIVLLHQHVEKLKVSQI